MLSIKECVVVKDGVALVVVVTLGGGEDVASWRMGEDRTSVWVSFGLGDNGC